MEVQFLLRLTSATIIAFLLSGVSSNEAQQLCSRGWSWNSAIMHCYKYNNSMKISWPDAHRHCLSEGGYLVKIDSADENTFLKNFIKSDSWIGAFREVIPGTRTFLWSFDWQPLNFTNWNWPEPNNWNSEESCGQMQLNGGWNDNNCRKLFSFVCEKEPDPCLLNNGGCSQICSPQNGKAQCSCKAGFTSLANGSICLDLSDSLTRNKTWQKKCRSNDDAPSRNCSCDDGYSSIKYGNVMICSDIDECFTGKSECEQICLNTPGSYKCGCPQGFILNIDGKTCSALENVFTSNSSWEVKCNRSCDQDCKCSPGFRTKLNHNVSTCTDIDECKMNNGGCHQACVNTVGSYQCLCQAGFVFDKDARTCTELTSLMNGVSGLLPCSNRVTTFDCKCRPGFQAKRLGPIWACFDVDECALGVNNGGCDHVCINTPGNYSCSCRDGFIKLEQGRICQGVPTTEATTTSTSASTKAVNTSKSTPASSNGSTTGNVTTLKPTVAATVHTITMHPTTRQKSTSSTAKGTVEIKPTPISAKQTGGQGPNTCQDQVFLLKVLIGCIAALIILVILAILYFYFMLSKMRKNHSVEFNRQDSITPRSFSFFKEKLGSKPEFVNPVYDEAFST